MLCIVSGSFPGFSSRPAREKEALSQWYCKAGESLSSFLATAFPPGSFGLGAYRRKGRASWAWPSLRPPLAMEKGRSRSLALVSRRVLQMVQGRERGLCPTLSRTPLSSFPSRDDGQVGKERMREGGRPLLIARRKAAEASIKGGMGRQLVLMCLSFYPHSPSSFPFAEWSN